MRRILSMDSKKFTAWLSAMSKKATWDLQNLGPFIMKAFPLVIAGRKNARIAGAAIAFSRHSAKILKNQGKLGLALHMKKAFTQLTQSLAGSPLGPLQGTPVRVRSSKDGIPRFIPKVHIRLIRQGGPRNYPVLVIPPIPLQGYRLST